MFAIYTHPIKDSYPEYLNNSPNTKWQTYRKIGKREELFRGEKAQMAQKYMTALLLWDNCKLKPKDTISDQLDP